jgi:hypothetical protein
MFGSLTIALDRPVKIPVLNHRREGAEVPGVPMGRTRAIAVVAAVAALAALGGTLGGVATANHQFPDVDTDSPFHDDIDDFVNAGCATGFPDGTYDPQGAVKRQQMARFIHACGGRVAFAQGVAGPVGPSEEILRLELQPGALEEAGFILLTATVRVSSSDTVGYPCEVQFDFPGLMRDEVWIDLRQNTTQGIEDATGAMQSFFTVAASTVPVEIPLNVVVTNAACTANVSANARATATYWPFDAVGDGAGESTPAELGTTTGSPRR